jgi:hypothetical protein
MDNNMNDSANKPDESLVKKGIFRLSLERFGVGGFSSLVVAFIFTALIHLVTLGKYWDVFFLTVAVIVALVSLPIGGVGGLILGSVWKHNKAAMIGGVIVGVLVPILFATLLTCPFFGGC